LGEGPAPVATGHGANAWDTGAQLVARFNKAVGIAFDCGVLKAEGSDVGLTAGGEEKVSAMNDSYVRGAASSADCARRTEKLYTFGVQDYFDAFIAKNVAHCIRNVCIFAAEEAWTPLEDGDIASEAAETFGRMRASVHQQ
jgi:hypothetical protein